MGEWYYWENKPSLYRKIRFWIKILFTKKIRVNIESTDTPETVREKVLKALEKEKPKKGRPAKE